MMKLKLKKKLKHETENNFARRAKMLSRNQQALQHKAERETGKKIYETEKKKAE